MCKPKTPLAQTRADMRAMRDYSKWADDKRRRLELKHGLNTPFKAYSWNREQTDVIEIEAYISLAPSGRCDAFYIVGEGCKDASVICETKEEVFEKLIKWQEDRLTRATNQHIHEFEALILLRSKAQ